MQSLRPHQPRVKSILAGCAAVPLCLPSSAMPQPDWVLVSICSTAGPQLVFFPLSGDAARALPRETDKMATCGHAIRTRTS